MNESTGKSPAVSQPGKKAGTPATGILPPSEKLSPAANVAVHHSPPVATGHSTVSPAPFGGKRGGKSRTDGLVPGSAEAKEADRIKDAARKSEQRAAAKAANPAPLPAATNPGGPVAGDGGGYVADSTNGESGIVAGVIVPWTAKILQRPARLLTRILDRVKKWDIMRRLDKSRLPESVKKEIASDIEWADGAKDDFANALAECASIELNRRGVSAQHSHWVNLALSAGELGLAHITLCERIESAILAAGLKQPDPGQSQAAKN